MIKGIIFDMDGVIIDSEIFYFDAFIKMIENDGKNVDIEYFKTIVGKSHTDSLNMVGEYYGNDFDGEDFLKRFDSEYRNNNFNYKNILFSYVVPLLKELKRLGYKLAMASSSVKDVINRVIEECEIGEYFEIISSGEDFEKSKPHPEIYLTTAKQLGLKPEECLAIEDSVYGIKAAKLAGMKVIAKKDFQFNINQDRADFIIDDLYSITGVLDIINSNNTGYNYKIFNHGSKDYVKSLFLRNNGLRKEFGLNIFNEDLSFEKDDLHLGIFDDDNIISSIKISKTKFDDTAQIKAVVVEENHRNNGLGKSIMKSGEILCKSLGYKKVILKAREKKVGFYEKLGYKISSEKYILEPTKTIHYDMIKNI
ncbi:HAD-IA family hydrolase [Miniphocaeibacter massiliensis]|uniref:HAD-IA family hydrolase n=1 Tax=Miniphocaeibacter massiliensis TaxID=2041841 RepID=UPI000C1C799B|nr:HAD-IA family hydrolase [Miniphocaeibacter massiliensis]